MDSHWVLGEAFNWSWTEIGANGTSNKVAATRVSLDEKLIFFSHSPWNGEFPYKLPRVFIPWESADASIHVAREKKQLRMFARLRFWFCCLSNLEVYFMCCLAFLPRFSVFGCEMTPMLDGWNNKINCDLMRETEIVWSNCLHKTIMQSISSTKAKSVYR